MKQTQTFPVLPQDKIAPLSSPNFIGSPTAPTQKNGTSDDTIATTEFVQQAFPYVLAVNPYTGNLALYYRE